MALIKVAYVLARIDTRVRVEKASRRRWRHWRVLADLRRQH